jgi:hypothetical protein
MKRSVTQRLQKCYSAMGKPNTQRTSIKQKMRASLGVEWRDDGGGLPEGAPVRSRQKREVVVVSGGVVRNLC